MDRPKQRYSVKYGLAILDDDNSEFGSADELDTDTDYEHSDREKGDDDTQDEDSDDTLVDLPQALFCKKHMFSEEEHLILLIQHSLVRLMNQ